MRPTKGIKAISAPPPRVIQLFAFAVLSVWSFMAESLKLATKKAKFEGSRRGDRRVKKPREHDRDGL